MGSRRRLTAALAVVGVAAAGWLGVPRRFEVEGVSMGPSLLPGDVVHTGLFPEFDRLRRPRRFERWVLAAADGLAIKRVVGLPGEQIAIMGGDLAIDGSVVRKGPRLLAEMGSVVADTDPDGTPPSEPGWAWSRPSGDVLDDAAFDAGGSRVLAAVRDVGLAAIVDVRDATATTPEPVRLRVGDTTITVPLVEPGRRAVVAGRLDGRLVVATWRVPPDARTTMSRPCLPPATPDAWQTSDPWPGPDDGDAAPALAIAISARTTLADVVRWRDVSWRPGAADRESWMLAADEMLVLGDHPAASIDCRHWGPIKVSALRARVAARSR